MPALLRQQYRDNYNNIITREINLDLELVRPANSIGIESKIYLFSDILPFGGYQQHLNSNAPITTRVTLSPQEAVEKIIDGKRTGNSTECLRTRLATASNTFKFKLEDIDLLQAYAGDAIVILDNIKNPKNKLYGIIKEIDGEEMHLYECGESKPFVKGAVVQNLSNRWHPQCDVVGSRSQLQRPDPVNFVPFMRSRKIEIAISIPPSALANINVTQYFDVYVRLKSFQSLDYHWIPDVLDVPADTETILVSTYNGGTDCGGGNIENLDINKSIYVGIVVKSKIGFFNVDESTCTISKAD